MGWRNVGKIRLTIPVEPLFKHPRTKAVLTVVLRSLGTACKRYRVSLVSDRPACIRPHRPIELSRWEIV